MAAADPAAPVACAVEPAAAVTVLLLDEFEGDPAVAAAAVVTAEDAEDVDDGIAVDGEDDGSVAPGTLSGAFGWPPSSGDGAILESVKRREIISGRQRRPPTCTGAPGTFLFL